MMNVLVIGAGAAGGIHTDQLLARGHNVTVFDENEARASTLASACGVACASDTEGDYDLSVIAVPTVFHYEFIIQELERGRDVVSEKPLCLRPQAAAEVVRLAESLPNHLYIAESQGYGGAEEMRFRINAGEFGLPVIWRICTMSKWRAQPWSYDLAIGGGAFLEGGVHILAVARALFGEAVNWQGSFRCFQGRTGPDNGQLIIDYERGDMLTLTIAWGTDGCFSGALPPLANHHGIIGSRACQPWFSGDDHNAMWTALLPAIEVEQQPFITVKHAAGAVADVWKCYEAGGVLLD